jgi:hypothetical protein
MEPIFFKSPLLRYYKPYTYQHQSEFPSLVRMHSNKLFLLFLHPDHPAMQETILELAYKHNTDALSGKRKKGAITMQSNTNLLDIKTENNTYTIRASVPGKLIETNDLLVKNPELIKQKEGFIAIIMPPLGKIEGILKTLINYTL